MKTQKITATSTFGVDVTFAFEIVINWSWNCEAENNFGDGALEVVFNRGISANETERLTFCGLEAKRLARWLCELSIAEAPN